VRIAEHRRNIPYPSTARRVFRKSTSEITEYTGSREDWNRRINKMDKIYYKMCKIMNIKMDQFFRFHLVNLDPSCRIYGFKADFSVLSVSSVVSP